MVRAFIFAVGALVLTFVLSAQSIWAAGAEHVYIEGKYGHFRLEEGKIYHFKWSGSGLEKPAAATEPSPSIKPAQAAKAALAPAKKTSPAAEPGGLSKITRESVERMINDIEAALSKKDFDTIARYLAPDAMIFLTVSTPEGTQSLRFNRDEYIAYLRQGLPLLPFYEYRVENVAVNISEDGRSATVTSDVHEIMGTQEMKVRILTRENLALELMDGNLRITKVVGKTEL